MNQIDDLHDLFEARADAADAVAPDYGDVRMRASHQHRARAAVGAVASVAAIGGAAVAMIATNGGNGQRVGTDPSPSSTSTATTASSTPPYRRTLPDGHEIRIRPIDRATYFGPFGHDHRWTQPNGCGPGLELELDRPATGPHGEGSGQDETVLQPRRSVHVGLTWASAGLRAGTYVPAVVAIVPDAVPRAVYRLVVDGQVVDSARADGHVLALAGPGAEQSAFFDVPLEQRGSVTSASPLRASGATLERVDDRGAAAHTEPLPDARSYDPPARCTTPPEATDLGPASPADSQDPDDVAIRGVVASLMPTNGNTSAALAHVDDPQGELANLGGVGVPNNMATVAREIHRDSPTHAWVKWGSQLGGAAVTPETPDVFVGWVEMNRLDGRWLMTKESYCAFASGPTIPRCPGASRYTPIPASGVSGITFGAGTASN
jgi:hypothetical protein